MAEDFGIENGASARDAALYDILRLIRETRDDETPVFDAILTRAAHLCEAPFAALVMGEATDAVQNMVAGYGAEAATRAYYDAGHVPMDAEKSFAAQAIREKRVIHLPDMRDTDAYRNGVENVVALAKIQGIRTNLFVPLITAEGGIGCFILFRKEVRPFDDDQIALVESFADQAVIAIEKTRQFREVQDRLTREAATREILEVISRSREDEIPVFDAILNKAAELCQATTTGLALYNPADHTIDFTHAVGRPMLDFRPGVTKWPADGSQAIARAIQTGQTIHEEDFATSELYLEGDPTRRRLVDEAGIRAVIAVPLLDGGKAIGVIAAHRHDDAPRFTDNDVALIETFAAQAVIAIENVRQFRELERRLAREAATSDVLNVISQTLDDETPVFETILDNAQNLCNAPMSGLILARKGDPHQVLAAHRGLFPAAVELFETGQMKVDGDLSYAAKSIVEAHLIALPDMGDSDLYHAGSPVVRSMVDQSKIRSVLFVPLIWEGEAIGTITLFRLEINPFTDEEIALVETFAAQAVIAIENVRRFKEVQTRLEREAATKRILQVISQTRDDEMPVFETILQQAERLCNAQASGLQLVTEDRKQLRMVVGSGQDRGSFQPGYLFDLSEPLGLCVAVRERRVVHKADLKNDDLYRQGHPGRLKLVDEEGVRTQLSVPLIQAETVIGTMTLSRFEQKPFSPDEIALVETFAAQAVIAIENVHRFREVQVRLEREAASREILQVISQSRADTAPVFDVILENAARLCSAPHALLLLKNDDGTHLELAANNSAQSRFIDELREAPHPLVPDGSLSARAVLRQEIVHVENVAEVDQVDRSSEQIRLAADVEGMRTVMVVPLIEQGEAIGVLCLYKLEIAPFRDDEIDLVRSFAAQAVIAIENVRQFNEVQVRLEREQASGEVLELINQSRDDTAPVFDAILERSARLCGSDYAGLALMSEDETELIYTAHHGPSLGHSEHGKMRWSLDGASTFAVAIAERRPVLIDDLEDTDLYRSGDPQRVAHVDKDGLHSFMAVPLIHKGKAIGAFGIARFTVHPFKDDDRALIEAFAAQAVIALENVRQFHEVQVRLEREAATREILEVISRSPDDERPVFDAILENASRLCDAPLAFLPMANEAATHVTVPAFLGVRPEFANALQEFNEPLEGSKLVATRAIAEAQVIRSDDLINDPAFTATGRWRTELTEVEGARSVLLVPMIRGDRAIGAIMLYRREVNPFTDDEVRLIEGFAAQAVIAVENVRQFKALESLNSELGDRVEAQVGELERMGKLKRFLPEQVADAVVSSGDDSMLSSHRALISALFCDIRGFTAFCETAEPEETIEVLQTYHEEMGKLISAHGAGVDHRAGDGIMVLFNDPLPCDDPAGDALRLAFEMRETMQGLCKRWRKLGHRLGFGVGISLGYATVGMVGSEGRFHYTASGTAVNLAARLCDMASDGEILLSPRAWIAVEDETDGELVGEVEIKGISAPVEVWRALAEKG